MVKQRIQILDGFRALAIISVMFYHYFSRWTPPQFPASMYPYGSNYDHFKYGKLGVQFFFYISGFVIYFTLVNTEFFVTFWKKRLVRLLPSMVIASLLTFTILNLFDNNYLFPGSHMPQDFVPSLLFFSPPLLNQLEPLTHTHFEYISGSYWSLWPEVQFYLFVSTLYFFNKKDFLRNFLILSILIIVTHYLILHFMGSKLFHDKLPNTFESSYLLWVRDIFNLIIYLPYFADGVLFYVLFQNRQNNQQASWWIYAALAFITLYSIYIGVERDVQLIITFQVILFAGFIYFPKLLSPFESKILTQLGGCSYFLYLIHEHIGVLAINNFAGYFTGFGFVFTILLMLLLSILSYYYTENIDKWIIGKLKKILSI